MAVGAALWRSLRAHQVYGANTDVGKTLISTVLCNAVLHNAHLPAFLKPVSTGPLDDADDRHIKRHAPGTLTQCLFQFNEPVSPHIAALQKSFSPPCDNNILSSVHKTLSDWASTGVNFALVETAGGVHSPGPNGNSQADLYRPLRLPIILIADSRLGGISSSISAYESLLLRGYDVHSVLLFQDDYYQNHAYLDKYFQNRRIPLIALPAPPARPQMQEPDAVARDHEALSAYYTRVAQTINVQGLLDQLAAKNAERINRLDNMASRAHSSIWYPFTQHHGMQAQDITVIDSAYGDYFQTYDDNAVTPPKLQPTFDGSASWWTQGLGHGNPDLALSAAYAAGRYGHVMFPGNIHEPALSLAEMLLKGLDNPRLQKVFYTDNGSAGMEVAVKMGLRAACARYSWDGSKKTISILGLKGSYHGDTIGVMDCSEPSTYNKKVEWYRGRGYWFDFPQVSMTRGVWKVNIPETLREHLGPDLEFSSLNAVFDVEKRVHSDMGRRYKEYIRRTIEDLVNQHGMKFGALIMEPVVLGAGGMLFCDPLFQRCLADVVRSHSELFSASSSPPRNENDWTGLPVIFDEVFTGLYRLGRRTAASFLNLDADITVNAKLLTGGLIPMCTTSASNEIFQAFDSPEKSDALLHGHSYTAHAIGCQVAVDSLNAMKRMEESGAWDRYREDWTIPSSSSFSPSPPAGEPGTATEPAAHALPEVWSAWSADFVRAVSFAPSVEGVYALGTVLVISLRDVQGGGYTSTAAKGLQARLSAGGPDFTIHSRVLGNVLYLMASVKSEETTLRGIEGIVRDALC